MSTKIWKSLRVPPVELRPDVTLTNGQAFGWRLEKDKHWLGVLSDTLYRIRQTETDTQYQTLLSGGTSDPEAVLRDYLWLSGGRGTKPTLKSRYARWGKADKRFRKISQNFQGVRLLRQEPFECLISFLCSSNNNIKRITLMLNRLRENFGTSLGTFDGEEFYSFPRLDQLKDVSEEVYRKLGLGYRAKFVQRTVKDLLEKPDGGEAWLTSLRSKTGPEIQEELCQFCGVGRKVADCVALFSLDALGRIPVDVHVWKITSKDYGDEFEQPTQKSLTKQVYKSVGDFWTEKFGDDAGWAHSVLFCADLPQYRDRLGEDDKKPTSPKKKRKRKEKAGGKTKRVKTEEKADP